MKNSGLSGQGFAQPENSSDNISVIKFEAAKVRIVKINGEPWFVAKDVCAALELSNSRMALQALDDDERNTVTLTYGIRGNPNHSAVSESGFYKLIARSRKATTAGTFAHRFSNWVIPSIRKTGSYGVPFAFLNDFSKRMASYQQEASKRGYKLQRCKEVKQVLENEEAELWRKYQPDFLGGRAMNNTLTKGVKGTACCIKRISFAWCVKHTSKMPPLNIANKKGEVYGLALWYQADQSSDVSAFLRRCLRLISPLAAATRKPAVLSPVSLSCSISSMTSWGIRTVVICDLAFFAPVAIAETPLSRCISVYAKKLSKKVLRCISLKVIFILLGDIHLVRAKPVGATNTNGPLTITLSEVTSWLLYMIPNQELLLHRYPLARRVGTIMTNLPHDYYVSLLKILLKKSTPAEKYSIALMLEREAMHIAGVNHSVFDAKAALVAKVTTGGRHACN